MSFPTISSPMDTRGLKNPFTGEFMIWPVKERVDYLLSKDRQETELREREEEVIKECEKKLVDLDEMCKLGAFKVSENFMQGLSKIRKSPLPKIERKVIPTAFAPAK